MANVRKHRRKWQAQWHYTIDGVRRQATRVFDTRGEAKRFAEQMGEQVERQGIVDPNRFTVRSYMHYWVDHHPKKNVLSPTTLAGYRRHSELGCRHIGELPLTKLTALHLDQMYSALIEGGGVTQKKNADGSRNAKPLAGRSIHHVHAVFRTALKQAVKWNLLPDAPTARATPPQPEKSPAVAMTKAEFAAVRDCARRANYPGLDVLVDMLGLTGLRRSEILGLSIDDIDFTAGEALIQRAVLAVRGVNGNEVVVREKTKTASSRRVVTIPPALLDKLKHHRAFIAGQALAFGADYRREPLLLFPEVGGRPMDPDALTSKLRSLLRSAGIRKKGLQPTHGYRHSMASFAFAAGVDLVTVQKRLGHSRPSTTSDIYLHPVDGEQATHAARKIERAMTGE